MPRCTVMNLLRLQASQVYVDLGPCTPVDHLAAAHRQVCLPGPRLICLLLAHAGCYATGWQDPPYAPGLGLKNSRPQLA